MYHGNVNKILWQKSVIPASTGGEFEESRHTIDMCKNNRSFSSQLSEFTSTKIVIQIKISADILIEMTSLPLY